MVILPTFPWPDTGSEAMEGLLFHGALLTPDLDGILGSWCSEEWGFGPAG